MPALPLDTAGPYVAGAYLVFLALVLVYVAIMATRLARIDRELAGLVDLVERRDAVAGHGTASAPAQPAGEPERVA